LKLKNKVLTSGSELTNQQRVLYIVLLGAAMGLIPFSIDPILPSFPHIAEFYGVDNNVVQWTITGLSIGLALGQLIAGPLSDSLGRRRPMLAAVTLFFLAEFGCFIAPTIETFIALRILLGIGAAGATVIGLAIIRDLYAGQAMIKFMGRVYIIQGIAPVVGPMIGSQMLQFMNFKQILLIFVGFGVLIFLGMYFTLVETLHSGNRRAKGFDGMLGRFKHVMKDRIYVGILIFSAMEYTALFTYLNTAPFLFQNAFNLSPSSFGIFFAINSLSSAVGVQLGAFATKFIRPQWVVLIVISMSTCIAATIAAFGFAGAPFWLVETGYIAMMLFFGAAITPMNGLALAQHGDEAGTAASLIGIVNFLMPAIATVVYNQLSTSNSSQIGLTMMACYLIAFLSLMFITRPSSVPNLAKS
jgi:DHA1 family bicyclomycin/chloramphenicol resistance-like MFS transporter